MSQFELIELTADTRLTILTLHPGSGSEEALKPLEIWAATLDEG